jgi:hypothetical protein
MKAPTSSLSNSRSPHSKALLEMQSAGIWNGSFAGKEVTLHQLGPYIGKLKSGLVRSLIQHFTSCGSKVCDPFSGSGVVALESVLLEREALANDLSKYAFVLTSGKLTAPPTLASAQKNATKLFKHVRIRSAQHDLRSVPAWVREFFHPETLRETLAAFEYCNENEDWFLAGCLCGILHHQRPGFLSYPSSHLVPYLRTKLFPQHQYPELYEYRSLQEKLLKKLERTYRRPPAGLNWDNRKFSVKLGDACSLPFASESVDFVLTSPPYDDMLDYARDNRLRLWFLGQSDWRALEGKLTLRGHAYELKMAAAMGEICRVLKPKKFCAIVIGENEQKKHSRSAVKVFRQLAAAGTRHGLVLDSVVTDMIPAARRSRRGTAGTLTEHILVFAKTRQA